MAKKINNLWLRISGVFLAVIGSLFAGKNSMASGTVSFTPRQISGCDYSLTTPGPSGRPVYVGDPIPSVGYTGWRTTSTYQDVPFFCWNAWAVQNKDQLCEDAFGSNTSTSDWSCGSNVSNQEYGFVYSVCNRQLGVDCELQKGSSVVYNAVRDYGGTIQNAFRIIGCINSSDTMTGATVNDYVYDLSGIVCSSPSACPAPGFGLSAQHSPKNSIDDNDCYIWMNDTLVHNMRDSTGTFVYESARNSSCVCFYDGETLCS